MNNPENFPSEVITWRRSATLARRTADKILAAGFAPEAIIAIARGGYVPARLLCDLLGVKDLDAFRIVHYGPGASKKEKADIASDISLDITGKDILLVDDLIDTGETFAAARDYLLARNPRILRTAALLVKKQAPVTPDFYGSIIRKWRWLIFPWAVIEDVGAFLEKSGKRFTSPDEAGRYLKTNYGLELRKKQLRDVLKFGG